MVTKKEHQIWSDTTKLMSNDLVTYPKIFLSNLRTEKDNFLEKYTLYKFASKMLPKNADVLDINCAYGFGAPVLSEMSNSYTGIDKDIDKIKSANKTNLAKNLIFKKSCSEKETFNSVVDLFSAKNNSKDINLLKSINYVNKEGFLIYGIKNEINDESQINDFNHHLEQVINQYFEMKLKFSFQNNLMSSGFSIKADYFIFLCICKVEK